MGIRVGPAKGPFLTIERRSSWLTSRLYTITHARKCKYRGGIDNEPNSLYIYVHFGEKANLQCAFVGRKSNNRLTFISISQIALYLNQNRYSVYTSYVVPLYVRAYATPVCSLLSRKSSLPKVDASARIRLRCRISLGAKNTAVYNN